MRMAGRKWAGQTLRNEVLCAGGGCRIAKPSFEGTRRWFNRKIEGLSFDLDRRYFAADERRSHERLRIEQPILVLDRDALSQPSFSAGRSSRC
jgi:hypothetical protein